MQLTFKAASIGDDYSYEVKKSVNVLVNLLQLFGGVPMLMNVKALLKRIPSVFPILVLMN